MLRTFDSLAFATAFFALACSRQPSTENTGADSATPSTTITDSSATATALRGTDWRLVALGDKPVNFADTARAARITLQPDSKQIVGSGGCNRLFGVYELNGDALRFSGVGSTKMACRDGMDTEAAFLPALLHVAKWKIDGQALTVSDSTGAVLARFEARAK